VPGRSGWYLVRFENEPPLVRAFGRDRRWWIPLPDGWLSGRQYEWATPRLAPLSRNVGLSPLAECDTVQARMEAQP
jgi:hypothetical protein